MTILRVKLPDIPDPSAYLESLEVQELEYALVGVGLKPVGQHLTSGLARLANMPRSDTLEVILPARVVVLQRLKLPRAKDAFLLRTLPNLVEDALVAAPEAGHYALLPGVHADGRRDVAITDRGWIRLARRVAQASPSRRSLCVSESMLVPEVPFIAVSTGTQTLEESAAISGFVRHAEGVLPFTTVASIVPPELLLLRSSLAAAGSELPLAGVPPEICKIWSAESGLTLTPSNWSWRNAAAAEPSISLFQGEFARYAPPGREWHRVWRWPIFLAAACVLMAIAGLNLHWLKLQREANTLRARMSADFSALFPGVSDRGEPLLMAKRQLGRQHSDDTFFILSQALAEALPAEAANTSGMVKRLDYRNGILKVELEPEPGASALAQQLRNNAQIEVRAESNTLILSRRRV